MSQVGFLLVFLGIRSADLFVLHLIFPAVFSADIQGFTYNASVFCYVSCACVQAWASIIFHMLCYGVCALACLEWIVFAVASCLPCILRCVCVLA